MCLGIVTDHVLCYNKQCFLLLSERAYLEEGQSLVEMIRGGVGGGRDVLERKNVTDVYIVRERQRERETK